MLAGCGRIDFGGVVAASGDAGGGDGIVGDGGGGGDGGDGAVASGVCGSTVALSDDFEDGVMGAEWKAISGNNLTVAETGGFLQITFASNVPAGQAAGYQQLTAMDYTGACTIVEVNEVPNPATIAQAIIQVGFAVGNSASMSIRGGMIYSTSHNGANVQMPDTRAWDGVAYRFLRIRESNGTWYWDASPDGVTFMQLGMVTEALVNQNAAYLVLDAATSSAQSNGGQVQFASVRVLVRP